MQLHAIHFGTNITILHVSILVKFKLTGKKSQSALPVMYFIYKITNYFRIKSFTAFSYLLLLRLIPEHLKTRTSFRFKSSLQTNYPVAVRSPGQNFRLCPAVPGRSSSDSSRAVRSCWPQSTTMSFPVRFNAIIS